MLLLFRLAKDDVTLMSDEFSRHKKVESLSFVVQQSWSAQSQNIFENFKIVNHTVKLQR
jgi:hypothetical protein